MASNVGGHWFFTGIYLASNHLAVSEHVFGGVYTYIYICIFIPHVYLQVMAILFNFELQYVMFFLAFKNLLNPWDGGCS